MKELITQIYKSIKSDIRYIYLKNLSVEKYESFLRKEYKRRTGDILNIKNPEKYTEKIQYAKLYLNTPLKTKLSDKYQVREWIEKKIGKEYLIPLVGAWDSFSEINFNKLPERFVLKLNSGSGTNIIVNNKAEFNYNESKLKFFRWTSKDFAFNNDLQLHYSDIDTKIIAEEFIEDKNKELPEYKFFCFHGQVYYCWQIVGRGSQEYRNVYDLNWNLQPWKFEGHENSPKKYTKPDNFEEMIEIAEKLSKDFPHVRVDLYNVDGKIYFGEMTFTSTGGYRLITPEQYNYMLGDLWKIESIK